MVAALAGGSCAAVMPDTRSALEQEAAGSLGGNPGDFGGKPSPSMPLPLLFHLFMYFRVNVCDCGRDPCATACVWRSEDSFWCLSLPASAVSRWCLVLFSLLPTRTLGWFADVWFMCAGSTCALGVRAQASRPSSVYLYLLAVLSWSYLLTF